MGALVEISDGHTAPVTAAGTFSIALSPGTYSVHVTGPSCTPTSPASVSVSNGGTTTYNTCITGSPHVIFKSVAVTGGNGNGIIDKNECNKLFVTLTNIGCLTDTGITATLSSSTPGVSVDPTSVPYPNIAEGSSAANTLPFEVSTSPSFACGTTINFTETVNDLTGAHVFNFSLPTCVVAPITFTGSIDGTDPTQNLRIFRDGVSSSCASPKAACPGTTGAGTRHYDAYTVTNGGGVTACVRVDVTGPCSAGGGSGLNIFSTAYLGTFVPSNICTNYLADEGASFSTTGTYFFDLPAGQSAVVVVNEVNSGQGCSAYSLKVSGLISGTDGGGDCSGQTLTALSPAEVWLGLKNSDDVGTNFDLKAEIYKNGNLIGSGETLNVSGGSSGFNNAHERAIALALAASNVTFLSGDKLSIKLYARIGATGHRSGTARLWFNDAQADTEFDTTIGGVDQDWYIRADGGLETTPGAGPKTTIDLFLDRLVGGNPYKLFGTWTHTF